MKPHGNVGAVTWRGLLWHYDYPSFNAPTLCDYSVGNGQGELGDGRGDRPARGGGHGLRSRAGTAASSVGDVGREHGGNIPGHETHERRSRRRHPADPRQREPVHAGARTGASSSYDRTATRALIKAIRATAPGHVKLIYFNDPVLIREGLTTLVRRPRRPPARPLLREVVPGRGVPLLSAVRGGGASR